MIALDDNIEDHPKFVGLSNDAFSLWVRCIGYCRRNHTDGFVPEQAALMRARCRTPKMAISELLRPSPGAHDKAPLWREVPGGYEIHDYLEWNPSKAEVESKREQKRAAGRSGGEASSEARRKRIGIREATNGQADLKHSASDSLAGRLAPAQAKLNPGSGSGSGTDQDPPNPPVGGGSLELVPVGAAAGPVERVWTAYVDAFRAAGRQGALVLNDARRKLIKRRLEDHAESELAAAARGVFRDAWCVEHRKTEPEWVWQNAGNIEKYADLDDCQLPASEDPYKAALVRLAQAKAARDAAEADGHDRPALPQNGPFTALTVSLTSREASGPATASPAGSQPALPMAVGGAS